MGITALAQEGIQRTEDWQLFFENEHVRFYARYADCTDPSQGLYAEYYLLKAENKSAEQVTLTWFTDTYYDGGCTNCDHSKGDRMRTLVLAPGESREGKCGPGPNIGLKVFSKWLQLENQRELSTLKVTDIHTSLTQ